MGLKIALTSSQVIVFQESLKIICVAAVIVVVVCGGGGSDGVRVYVCVFVCSCGCLFPHKF